MPKLETRYLGLTLKNPIIAGSCPLTSNLAQARQLQEAGASALVLRSIFEEQIQAEVSHMYDALEFSGTGEGLDYLRADLPMQLGQEGYLATIRELCQELEIPVIASVNCVSAQRWTEFARKIEQAGAAAIELNIYDIPDDPTVDSASIEEQHLELIEAVQSEVGLPIAVKLSPFYTGMANFARRASSLGVAGLVLFNRFLQPDIDIDTLELVYETKLSSPEAQRVPLRWIAILRDLVDCDLALTSGVHDAPAAIRAILAGANTVQVCSALYRPPVGSAITGILEGLNVWMEDNGYKTLADFRGKMRASADRDGPGYERAHYVKLLGEQHK